ncbi:acylphosphatase [Erwinia psidii]|uniref:Acylphosphatase n=1 Tax=Erwinia psidii TaxID=69224 RepID=A0A3N6SKI0_9GAMM|nr:acylphosphatase [Erwinia psidii]MCX8957436.1 acylphosphatase [Erwinia psidii]MCX8959805.1 acylphosphatase [Erwinia psidii]MCX8964749.1 acylphosphatase [Erwinia psidii]RQM38146.1 acylphosphatase [Erwinia psidii]
MATIGMRAWAYGLVQGVGFRYHTQSEAKALKLKGYARNLADGSVEVLAVGEERAVETLINWLKAGGPRSAKVERVLAEPYQPVEQPANFTIG